MSEWGYYFYCGFLCEDWPSWSLGRLRLKSLDCLGGDKLLGSCFDD